MDIERISAFWKCADKPKTGHRATKFHSFKIRKCVETAKTRHRATGQNMDIERIFDPRTLVDKPKQTKFDLTKPILTN